MPNEGAVEVLKAVLRDVDAESYDDTYDLDCQECGLRAETVRRAQGAVKEGA